MRARRSLPVVLALLVGWACAPPRVARPEFAVLAEHTRAAAAAQRWLESLPACPPAEADPPDTARLTGQLSVLSYRPRPSVEPSRGPDACTDRVRVTRFQLAARASEVIDIRGPGLPAELTSAVSRCTLAAWFDGRRRPAITARGVRRGDAMEVRSFCFDDSSRPRGRTHGLAGIEPGVDEVLTQTRAQVAVDAWVGRLPRCRDDVRSMGVAESTSERAAAPDQRSPEGGSEPPRAVRRGTLTLVDPSVTLQMCPPQRQCCEEIGYRGLGLVDPDTGRRTDFASGSHVPRPRGSDADCEWTVWARVLRRTPLIAIGAVHVGDRDEELMHVDHLCVDREAP